MRKQDKQSPKFKIEFFEHAKPGESMSYTAEFSRDGKVEFAVSEVNSFEFCFAKMTQLLSTARFV